MIKRIVRMSFEPSKVEDFKQIFNQNWKSIKGFEGCSHVELLQDINQPTIFFTYSEWLSEEHLNKYRNSELFDRVWTSTKKLFNDKPQAWSVQPITFN